MPILPNIANGALARSASCDALGLLEKLALDGSAIPSLIELTY